MAVEYNRWKHSLLFLQLQVYYVCSNPFFSVERFPIVSHILAIRLVLAIIYSSYAL